QMGELVEISSFHVHNDYTYFELPDLIITAGKISYEMASKHFPSCPKVIAKRNLSLFNLERLCLLPEGKVLLVINYTEEATKETINSLVKMGLNHLKYVPYWPGCHVNT